MNYRNTPFIAAAWAVFRESAPGDSGNHLYLFGAGTQLGVLFEVIARLQAPTPDSIGVVTLRDGTEILLGEELRNLDFHDEADKELFGRVGGEVMAKGMDDSYLFTQVNTPSSYFNGFPKTRPVYTKPVRPGFMKDHALYNIVHFRVWEQVAPKDVPSGDIDWDNIPATPSSRGGATVAFYVEIGDAAAVGHVIAKLFAGVSVCSSMDNFNRAKGAESAVERAIKARENQAAPSATEVIEYPGSFPSSMDILVPVSGDPLAFHLTFPLIRGLEFEDSDRGPRLKSDARMMMAFSILASLDVHVSNRLQGIRARLGVANSLEESMEESQAEESLTRILREMRTKIELRDNIRSILETNSDTVRLLIGRMTAATEALVSAAPSNHVTTSGVEAGIDGFTPITPLAANVEVAEGSVELGEALVAVQEVPRSPVEAQLPA